MSDRPAPLFLLLVVVGAVAWMLCQPARSEEQKTVCPRRLEPGAFAVHHAPAGWVALMPQDVRLTTGGMLHGPPNESGYLVPAESKGAKEGSTSIWRQRWTLTRPRPETWLYCGYGGGGAPLQLFRRVAVDATECTLTSRTTDGLVDEIVFICR